MLVQVDLFPKILDNGEVVNIIRKKPEDMNNEYKWEKVDCTKYTPPEKILEHYEAVILIIKLWKYCARKNRRGACLESLKGYHINLALDRVIEKDEKGEFRSLVKKYLKKVLGELFYNYKSRNDPFYTDMNPVHEIDVISFIEEFIKRLGTFGEL